MPIRSDRLNEAEAAMTENAEFSSSSRWGRLRRLEREILRRLAGNELRDSVLEALCLEVEQLVDGAACAITLLDEDGRMLVPTFAPGHAGSRGTPDPLPVGPRNTSCGAAVFHRELVIVEDVESSPLWADYLEPARQFNIRASWSNPLYSGMGEILGCFSIALDRTASPDDLEVELLHVAGYLASIIIDSTRARESLHRYEEMVRSSRDMMVYIDRDYIYRAVSTSYADYYGLTRDELIGRHIATVVGEEAFKAFIKDNLDKALNGEPVDWQGWIELSHRPVVHMTSHYDAIINDNEVVGIVVVIRNTTASHLTEQALRESEERFELAMRGMNDGLWDWNLVTGEIYCSPTWGKMLGYTDEEYKGEIDDFYPIVHPDDRQTVYNRMNHYVRGTENRLDMEARLRNKDGQYLDVLVRLFGIRDRDTGKMKRVVGINVDISEKKQAERRLQESESRFRNLFDDSPTMFFTLDSEGLITSINQYGAQHLGYHVDSISGSHLLDFVDKSDHIQVRSQIAKCVANEGVINHCEFRVHHKYGNLIWVRAAMRLISWESSREVLVSCEDITETRILSDRLEYQAKHDSLTGLINRAEFERRLRRILNSTSTDQEHALCFLDMDQFKVINDTCGHLAGDELLRRISHMLGTVVRKRDSLARVGGDEFAVLLEHCPLEQAKRVASDMLEVVQSLQFTWDGKSFNVGITIGMVQINENSGTLTDVLSAADAACYAAKDAGRNRLHVYHQDDMAMARRRTEMRWVSEINQALGEGRLCLARQPIVPLVEQQDAGRHYELLIRIRDKKGELIYPGAFLSAAERYNLATKLDRWVVSTAFSWLLSNPGEREALSVCAINLSGHSLSDPDFLQFLLLQLQSDGIDATQFCFEVTETAAISNLGDAVKFISSLKEIGCSFALDDFGAGLSSFNYLKNLPVDYLKIDGAFVREITRDPIDAAMVRSINDIGHVMGKRTIAEFVENDEILEALREIGVDYAQGFGPGRPELIDLDGL